VSAPRSHLPAPPQPSTHGPPPPPPPAPAGSDAEARASAATWVAAAGALLLLAAAGTFLAVSWDTLGLSARIAVVGAITGAALVGGHRLRSRLPAVGSVVYHLGALLLPVDALGLALHLDAEVAVRWLSVGIVAMVALPPLARAGRSRTLAWAAVAGVPVAATGVGLAGLAPAAVVVAAAEAVLVAAVRPPAPAPSPRSLAGVLATAASVLALLAVYGPLVVGVAAAALTPGGPWGATTVTPTGPVAAQLIAAGWLADVWTTGALAGLFAVATLAVAATRQRSSRLALATPITTIAALLVTVMPPATPRLALLLAPAVAFLGFELAAAVATTATTATTSTTPGATSPVVPALWSHPLRTAAWLAELTTTMLLPVVLLLVLGVSVPGGGDVEAAFALAVGALGLLVAIVRRRLAGGDAPEVPVLLGGAGLAAAAAVALLVPTFVTTAGLRPLTRLGWLPVALVLLATAGVTLGDCLRPEAPARRRGMVAVAVGTVLAVLATTSMLWQPLLLAVAVVSVLVVAAHLRCACAAGGPWAAELVAAALPVAVGIAFAGLLGPGTVGGLGSLAATGWTLLALLALTLAVAPLAPARAGTLTAVALIGLLAGGTAAGWTYPAAVAPGQAIALGLVGGGVASLVPLGLAVTAIVAVAVRWRDARLAVLVAPLAVRALVVVALAIGDGRVLPGRLLLVLAGSLVAVALVAGIAALLAPASARPGLATVAGVALVVGWLLLAHDPTLRAGFHVALGVTVAVGGLLRRQAVVAHLGGGLATFGLWQLLGLRGVESLDLYALPLAVHLWATGQVVRRRHGTSSWLTDVPPLLLVAVPALAERLAGGPGWHAVLAGGLAVAAVAHGGAARLGGPLVVGTVVLVATVVVEVVAMIVAVPTWVWLAAGGALLLVAAAAIERTEGSPVTAARRLREVVAERFD
jgi:hypothetical protein